MTLWAEDSKVLVEISSLCRTIGKIGAVRYACDLIRLYCVHIPRTLKANHVLTLNELSLTVVISRLR